MLPMNELGVLVSLFPEKSPRTLKEIQKKCPYSYERIHSAVNALGDKNALDNKRYGNVIVLSPNYSSDLTFLAFVHYMVAMKSRMYDEHRARPAQIVPGSQKASHAFSKRMQDDMISCLMEIERLEGEIISIAEISRTPKNKISFFYVGGRNLLNDLMKMEYRYNIKIDARMETEETLRKKRDDPNYLNSVVLKGLEKFYRLFYL